MLEQLFGVPFTLLSFIVALSVVVFVHEFGHFYIARRCGVRCEAFSIGFGPELFGMTDRHGTRWKFSLIPLGGYVKMFGEGETMQAVEGGVEHVPREMTDEEKAVSLKYKTVGQRAATIFAGPAVNFIFAIGAFFIIYLFSGRPIVEPLVGTIEENSAAAEVGLQTGDRITAIDGKDVKEFDDIWRLVQLGTGEPMRLAILRAGERIDVAITPRTVDPDGKGQKYPTLGFAPMVEPIVGAVMDGSAAAEAGVKAGDRVVAIDGNVVRQFEDIRRFVQQARGAPVTLTVARGQEQIAMTMTPRMEETKDSAGDVQRRPMLGIATQGGVERLNPLSAMNAAVVQTYRVVEMTGIALGQMVAGKRGTEDLGGPIRIAQFSGQAAKTGLVGFVLFVAVLSINLGLINLLPVPLLDGGHLLFYAIEAVRGRPLSERAQEWGMRIGLAVVGSLMLFAIGNDLLRVVWPFVRSLAT